MPTLKRVARMTSQKSAARKGTVATVSALLIAVISSACCWLPLLLLAFGLSGGVVAASFESWRPVMTSGKAGGLQKCEPLKAVK